MGLKLYDDQKNPYPELDGVNKIYGPERTHHDGFLGSVYEYIFYVRNDDAAKYYTNLTLALVMEEYDDRGEYGDSGWSVKMMYGQREPTEAEWDLVRPGDAISLPNIGTTLTADTYTYHPVWVRVFCPGNMRATIRESQYIKLYYFDRNVGE